MRFSKGVLILSFFCSLILIFAIHSFNLHSGHPDVKCDGCPRSAYIASCDTNADSILEDSIRNLLAEAVITPCFHIKASIDPLFKPPEYLFRITYFENLEGKIKSRLTISLYYNGTSEEHVKTWTTETENPDAKFTLHKNRMFRNPNAMLKKFRPLEQTVLNDFEKKPYKCRIEAEKEAVVPEEEIEVKLTNIHDIEGRKSREFNRIVVQALEGEIIGGEKLEVDPDLKAFKVGNGTIQFKYKAPHNCRKNQDTIFVYNSCDILREDLYPLSKTVLRDKIAEQKISCLRSLEVNCVWTTDIDRTEGHLQWGGTAHMELRLATVDTKINGNTVKTLKGTGTGSQECWVRIDRPYWIENIRYSDFEVSIQGTPPWWIDFCNFGLTTKNAGLSWDICRMDEDKKECWPHEDGGVGIILSIVIFTMYAKPDSVFQESGEDILKTHYEITARWKD